MSWGWLIDVRGEEPKVDWPRLAVAFVFGEIVAGVLVWLLMEYVGALAMLLVALPIGALLIALDVSLRRRHPDNP